MRDQVAKLLHTLDAREERQVECALDNGSERTLKVVGEPFSTTLERARQIDASELRKWRESRRFHQLRILLNIRHDIGKGSGGEVMDDSSLLLALSKLAAAGEQAGFTLEEMIDLLDRGLEVVTLLELICLRLNAATVPPVHDASRFRWVV